MRRSYKNYTDNDLIVAIKNSRSIRQVLIALNLASQGGNYATIHNAIERLQIDTTHFTGMGWKIDNHSPTIALKDYLSNKFHTQSFKLKNRLIKENVFQSICSSCNLTEWVGRPIPLELDHIDGNSRNNLLTNLRLLCPNCHALTPTYRGKNKGKGHRR